ncbi:hypothetical protein [Neokomagataea anthophila]|uniref:Uncharacterized protein n=2 Tax=Neokomagataea TaxID=1223423 RepID=A0ABS5E8K6_9PROT|nr:hypothetical protein [Neokomagataea anthophila]MBR0560245.1 hypothetical protein [Neokomagataea anthophila]
MYLVRDGARCDAVLEKKDTKMHALLNAVCTVLLVAAGLVTAVIAVVEAACRGALVHFGVAPELQTLVLLGLFFFLLYGVLRLFGRILAFLLIVALVLYILQDFSLLPAVHHAAMVTQGHLERL